MSLSLKASILALACIAAFPALAATPIDQSRPPREVTASANAVSSPEFDSGNRNPSIALRR